MPKKDKTPTVRFSQPVKLKDTKDRFALFLKPLALFGFFPETMIIEKIRGENNKIRVGAIIPDTEKNRKKISKGEAQIIKGLKPDNTKDKSKLEEL